MESAGWLPLTEYAIKYRVSVSTLRRRIKAETIKFRFDNGKYFLADSPPDERNRTTVAPSQAVTPAVAVPLRLVTEDLPAKVHLKSEGQLQLESSGKDEPIISTATKLLNELKKAYSSILQEREELIIQLKREVTDLKTLVRVLEDENERLKFERGIR